jgi:hypothetical protein
MSNDDSSNRNKRPRTNIADLIHEFTTLRDTSERNIAESREIVLFRPETSHQNSPSPFHPHTYPTTYPQYAAGSYYSPPILPYPHHYSPYPPVASHPHAQIGSFHYGKFDLYLC